MDTYSGSVRELNDILGRVADRVTESGTRSESQTLGSIAVAAQNVCPGAAAALVDWQAAEIVRLRAFGVVHGAVLRDLTPVERSLMLADLLGASALALAV
jgi:hypothetical protein